jgi:hypothetical protein
MLSGESAMNSSTSEDVDVPALAVQGLTEATRKALLAGEIVIVRDGNLLKISHNATVEVIRAVPGRKKVEVRTKRLKK